MISGVDLTLLFGPGVPVPAPPAMIEALQSVNVTEQSGTSADGFELVFALPKNSPLTTVFLLAGGLSAPIVRVALSATINGVVYPLINGVALNTNLVPGSGGQPSTLTVRGKDLTAVMDVIPFDGLPYPGMPPVARMAVMLAKYAWLGVIPQLIPSLEGPPLPTDRIPLHKGTDLAYIQTLSDEAGYTFFLKPGPQPLTSVAYWGPEIRIGEVQPALTAESGVTTNVESLSFSFDQEQQEIPLVFIHNQLTKAPIPVPIPSSIPFHPPLGAIPPLPPRIKRINETGRLKPYEAIVRGFAHAAQNADAVRGTGSLDVVRYGRPLRARALVGVRGAGLPFDGKHYVDSVTHQLARGSYKQSFTLKRNGLLPTTPGVAA